ncbi:anti-sigma-D factor RsdA [Mycobacterium sp. TY815]|nr:anti-sigma-D factor RsdA [Mycobacterium sp. TY815]MDP7703742.1 anti-sigma-D factor RsdA [Mycobacterium sp. TY815]
MRSSDFGNDRPALDEVAHTDLLLDALAARTEGAFGGSDDLNDQALTALLGEWRDDLRWPPASALVSQDEAEDALRDGMMDRSHGRRGLAAVGSVAATLLILSGFGAVVGDARPGDLLYGLHAMMFNEPRVSDDQIVLSAKADLAKVEQMIAQGQWAQAQTQLAEVSSTLQAVNDGGRRQGLLEEVNQLNTKVEKRDPNATARPASPPSTKLAVPDAPANSWTPQPLAPATEASPPVAVEGSTSPEPTEPVDSTTPTLTPTTTPLPATTTAPSPSTTPTTTKPNASTTTPSTSPSPATRDGTATPTTTSKPKPGTSVTPNSPAAGAASPAPSTPSGQLWDRTSGPATPRTPFPGGTAP